MNESKCILQENRTWNVCEFPVSLVPFMQLRGARVRGSGILQTAWALVSWTFERILQIFAWISQRISSKSQTENSSELFYLLEIGAGRTIRSADQFRGLSKMQWKSRTLVLQTFVRVCGFWAPCSCQPGVLERARLCTLHGAGRGEGANPALTELEGFCTERVTNQDSWQKWRAKRTILLIIFSKYFRN